MSKQQQPLNSTDKWSCPECYETEVAETINSGKPKFDKEFVSTLLTFVYNRMLQTKNVSKSYFSVRHLLLPIDIIFYRFTVS